MSRHTARIHALNLVFQFPFHPEWDENALEAAAQQYLKTVQDLSEWLAGVHPRQPDREFICEEVTGTFRLRVAIDSLITGRLKEWTLDRIAKIDLAILRLAVYEMRYVAEISIATAIDEAVELAKLYSNDESPAFINGLLGRIADTLTKEEPHATDCKPA